jgi:dTDP-glucose 4,6-dehydratase
MKLLITGGAGFIGANLVRYALQRDTSTRVVNLDALTYAGNLENLREVEADPRYQFVKGDVCDVALVRRLLTGEGPEGDGAPCDAVLHLAAESHVDRSILGSADFVRTNVMGTHAVLEAAKAAQTSRIVAISTDEVYGSLGPTGLFTETTPLDPSSPYSSTKAAADLLCFAYHRTHKLPVLVTRGSNNYGPYQFPEKLIPLLATNGMEGKKLPIYGDGLNVRDWLHVEDHCAGLFAVLERGREGEAYNIGGAAERTNMEVVQIILRELGLGEDSLTFVKDRPGHDRRYALDISKSERELGWTPKHVFERSLPATIAWYRENRAWWSRVKSGAYRDYYAQNYGAR